MRTDRAQRIDETGDRLGRVASRFVSSLFRALTRRGISTQELLGDLPIAVDERGELVGPVHLDPFRTLMRRLERDFGGREGLERCGEWMTSGSAGRTRQAALAFVASPASLYRALLLWAIPRSFPRVAVALASPAPNRLVLDIEIPSRSDPCTPILHVTTGILRRLPHLIDLPDAVVESRIDGAYGHWEVTLPSSRTGLALILRSLRALRGPASVLAPLERRQLELHSDFVALRRAHDEALLREQEMHARTRAVVDMICEVDATGRIVFVNEAARDVVGYSPEQMMGSHYRLWVPTAHHALATKRFEAFKAAPIGTTVNRLRAALHAAHGRRVATEVSLRSYADATGAWRGIATLRPLESPERAGMPRDEHRARRAQGAADRMPQGAALVERLRDQAGLSTEVRADAPSLAPFLSERAQRPLAESLARLVALLEAEALQPERSAENRSLAATRRMTRVVEHVLAGEEREAAEWVEVEKLVGRLRDSLAARSDATGIELRFDPAAGPSELHGIASLLEILLASLVDWGVEIARAGAAEALAGTSAGTPAHCALAPALELGFERDEVPATGGTSASACIAVRIVGRPSAPLPPSVDAELALAIARDAATALGGTMLAPRDETPGVRACRLPQPPRLAAFSRSSTV